MKIVCIGDSLTEGIGVRKEEAWPFLLQKKLTVVIVNRGISGDTTTGMLGRFYYDVILCKPTHVVIMGGVNDLWWNLPIHLILSNIYSMFKQAIYHGIIPVIGIPTPIFFKVSIRKVSGNP
ncbi:GDSL-type esterase/lipase family protein [Aneurinibacillus tyrosinisolvens]|uniref:GDSL-type esterase/lipase family protein n=1 Tax=Aneurinibacillus tyrosinisolvens TaxID=1443435 RepID=UPI000699DFD9|nr:GDSL-type esterase/lipase family protein [Aneurinibacillus tyrosinisolvens]